MTIARNLLVASLGAATASGAFISFQSVGADSRIRLVPGSGPDAPPMVINAPGSYVLTANINGASGQAGIQINSSNVTVDLNGWAVVGVTGATYGIHLTSNYSNVVVHGGAIRSWPNAGVYFPQGTNCYLYDLVSSLNGSDGITLQNGRITNCLVRDNAGDGLDATTGCSVSGVTSEVNALAGIRLGSGATVSNCTANSNNNGFAAAGEGCVFIGCTAALNAQDGFTTGAFAGVFNACSARANSQNGFEIGGAGGVLNGCTAFGNAAYGITSAYSSTIVDCNVQGSGLAGISTGVGSEVARCAVGGGASTGIQATASHVHDCTVSGNQVHGIYAGDDCRIVGNHCHQNGGASGSVGAGIFVVVRGVVDGNTLNGNEYGIMAPVGWGFPNTVFRNSATNSTATNYSFNAAVDAGPVGTAATSTSPWANIAF